MSATELVGVAVVAAGEPASRLVAMAAAVRAQVDVRIDLCIAVPPAEVDDVVAAIGTGGAVERVRVLANPGGARSAGLNLCANALATEVVCRIDARSTIPPAYVRTCADRLARDRRVGIVGGHQVAVAPHGGVVARSVARVLADPVASGGAAYRRRSASGPVDTVYLGAFRRTELLDVGGWPEDLAANEDFELSERYRADGRVVWLEPGLDVAYEPRASVVALAAQYASFGRAKVTFWRSRDTSPGLRQWIGVAVPPTALLVVAALLPLDLRLGLLAIALGALVLGLADLRRGAEGDPRVRLLATVLAPLPATAFSAGALAAFVRRVSPAGPSAGPPRGPRSGSAARAR